MSRLHRAAAALGALALAGTVAGCGAGARPVAADQPMRHLVSTTRAPASPSAAPAPTHRSPTVAPSPGLGAEIARFLARRSDTVSVAIYDARTGRAITYRPGARYDTASIVKAQILGTLLHQADAAHRGLTDAELDQAVPMIEQSDNDAATDLWRHVGGAAGVLAFDRAAGLTHTTADPAGHWGLTRTTAPDQVRLVRALTEPGVLSAGARRVVVRLMGSVDPDQGWGVGAGAPDGVQVLLKNGWLPRASHGWRVNSIGRVTGQGRDYVIAVLSTDNPTMSYGVETVEGVARLAWSALG